MHEYTGAAQSTVDYSTFTFAMRATVVDVDRKIIYSKRHHKNRQKIVSVCCWTRVAANIHTEQRVANRPYKLRHGYAHISKISRVEVNGKR